MTQHKTDKSVSRIYQLSLFDDPRDGALEKALHALEQEEWYQDPIHRFGDGGQLWAYFYLRKITVDGQEISLDYCREWMARGHPGWNEIPVPLAALEAYQRKLQERQTGEGQV